jgi:hypothetical protein
MGLEEIVENLTALGIAHEVLRSGAEGAILLLPEYGRVLGVWPHWRSESVLWVNPDFILSLRAGAKDDGWRSPGGDRVWLAPAHEFLGGSARLAEPAGSVPASIDPGRYVFSLDRGVSCMANRGEAWARASGVRIRFRVTRRISPLDEAGLEKAWGPTWLRRAGFEEEIELEVDGKCTVPVQLWNLVHVPPGSKSLPPRLTNEGKKTLLCLQDQDSERARLLVKSYAAAGEHVEPTVEGPSVAAHGGPVAAAPGELTCMSPPVGSGSARRLRWKTSACAFSGRITEIRQIASRIAIL